MEKPPKTLRATALAALQAVALGAALASPALAADKIAVLVKSLGIRFFDAVHQGAQEAAKELSNIEIIYTGPAKPTAEGQIEIINALISQKVAAIVISANDPDALAPVAQARHGARHQGAVVRLRRAQGRPHDAPERGERCADR
ncbi:substrate-binding domain-containing protein [Verminephrobacter eiseniae]|uniref:substrate-binding domain-containing protein n=1 Tax=Verminephrobacter eiseniae TaxID=364317 RepID=UPI002FBDBB97